MKNLGVLVWLLSILLGSASIAHAGPAWCKAAGDRLSPSDQDAKFLQEKDERFAVQQIVAHLCFGDERYKSSVGVIQQAKALWQKKLDMQESDWADAADWVSNGRADSDPTFRLSSEKAAWSSWGPVDQYTGLTAFPTADPAYIADALGARLTEVGRFGFIEHCVKENADKVVEWAMCQGDLDAFDAKKFAAELRADKTASGTYKMALRVHLVRYKDRLAAHNERVKAAKAKDPGYAKMFAIADQARKDVSKANPKLVELAALMDDARITNSRKASEGCMEKAWDAWKGVLATIPAKQLSTIVLDKDFPYVSFFEKALAMLIGTADGYLASLSLYTCGRLVDNKDYLNRSLGNLMARWPGYRGPRSAVQTAILSAGIQLDDRDARIEYPDVSRGWLESQGGSSGGGWGEVAKVKVDGQKATIDFAKVKSKQTECVKGHQTNRVTQIRSDGQLVYQYVCEKSKVVVINQEPFPTQTVNARYANGLKKGMFIGVVEDVVLVAYPKNGASVPAMVAGVPVK